MKKSDTRPAGPTGASKNFGTVPFTLHRHISPHGQVTAVSMMKDEGPYVIEWVAHHLVVGFTDLVVYTNDCTDGTDDMLIRLEELGLCHHRRNVIPDGLRPQPSALNYAQQEPVVCQSDWVMVFDADEFLSIRYGDGTLDDLIAAAKAQDANGIVVTWRTFGSGGIVDWSRAPVTEQYLMAAPRMWNKGWGVKTLFQFDPDYWKLGIHRPKMKNRHIKTDFPDKVNWINGSGHEMVEYFKFRGWRSIVRTVGYDWVQMNHYAVKSVDSYAIRRLRGNVNNKADKYNSDYWSLQDRNEERDDTMLRYTTRRNQIIAELLKDDVLQRLHVAAIARVEAKLAEIKQTAQYRDLVESLAIASKVPISQVVAKPPQPRDKDKIAALMTDVEKQRIEAAQSKPRKDPTGPVEAIPVGSYNASPVMMADRSNAAVFQNHSLMLPADHGVFSEPGLQAIEAGKFERGLARKMPAVLAQFAKVLEIGSAVGFLAGHCANVRPDLRIVMQENDPALRDMMRYVFHLSDRSLNDQFRLSDAQIHNITADLSALIVSEKPDALLLADSKVTPDVLAAVIGGLSTPLPQQVFIYGRLIEYWHAQMPQAITTLESHGYIAAYDFDPSVCRGFTLTRPKDEPA